ncbi:transcriptional regulator, effector binding domain protein [Fimbriimonas ginsengisoli Gsoil 348]|uniref:Transcriptional regulator, effector binding domain protein n=1 Tax=Fimbriimonas ginsengisoli Gsoil 348 TaxID=661478 RepID=A0A068NWR9_FIMGI|nr:transcriptional regulator, effector binding domain protein [Fimbriimonas ginsengisoli Gsoil 348]
MDLIERSTVRLGTIRRVGPYGSEISHLFERLGQIAGPAGLFAAPGVETMALYHDDPRTTATNELRSDAAVTVPAGVPMPDGLTEFTLPGGRYARYVHIGPYDGLGDAWKRFTSDWMPKSGHIARTNVPVVENYMNMPGSVPDDQLRTELYIPIE